MRSDKKMKTPWGIAQHIENLAPGVDVISTASHGGIRVSGASLDAMPQALRDIGDRHGPDVWFEEDIAWSAVCIGLPELFDESDYRVARGNLKHWYPAAFTKIFPSDR